ncbi:MAG: glycosyltransferase family 39 protein, partial [Chloroflexota bacterium]|nr:glycosyltransferase family 39 protein [Chloroflexota bacterium]
MERATSTARERAQGAWAGNPSRVLARLRGAVGAVPGQTASWARWERVAFGAVLLLAAVLNLARLDRQGDGNLYYTATVKSMLTSWSNFFFASFDPGGLSTETKPPLGFWVQAAFAAVFGVSGWSVILPQAIAGVLSVALLHGLVRRSFGPAAGLVAGLVLALTPISVAVNRNNTIDALLILCLLGAAWAALRATERGSLRWLLLAAALVGVGFNIKMLQAYLVLPAIFLVYLVGAERRLATRVAHLAAATVVLLVVSFSWATAVELTPEDRRPYVGSSENNSVINLVLGYNGLLRLLPDGALRSALLGDEEEDANPIPGTSGGNSVEIGAPGPLRLFNRQLGGQIAWLLPLAVVGLVAAWWQGRPGLAGWSIRSGRHRALVLWGGWLLTAAGFFSVASLFHRYYLVTMAAPIAALAGAGVDALWA